LKERTCDGLLAINLLCWLTIPLLRWLTVALLCWLTIPLLRWLALCWLCVSLRGRGLLAALHEGVGGTVYYQHLLAVAGAGRGIGWGRRSLAGHLRLAMAVAQALLRKSRLDSTAYELVKKKFRIERAVVTYRPCQRQLHLDRTVPSSQTKRKERTEFRP
jgi:hypothetical protein